jgi:hypothetical protein
MTGAPQRPVPVRTVAEAESLAVRLSGTMDALVAVLEAESKLVRAGRIRETGEITAQKAELARRWIRDLQVLQADPETLRRLAPGHVESLRARYDGFRAELQVNMTVLATAKAVAEDLVHEIADIVAKQDRPAAYGASGNAARTTPSASRPVTLSKAI